MGEMIQLRSADGFELQAYLAEPTGTPRAGLVILQEVFGITEHIKRVTDQFAAEGYLAMAPSLFDRVESGIVLDYSDVDIGREVMMRLDRDQTVLDVGAAADQVRSAGKIGAVGYCWGGAIADLAACRLAIDAAVSYYGRATVDWLDPVMYHFGEQDALIPPETVASIRAARQAGVFHVYAEAGHGFNCDDRQDYRPDSARLARERTLGFFEKHLGP